MAGACLGGAALNVGTLASFAAAPLAASLVALAIWLRRGPADPQAGWLVATGGLSAVLGLSLILGGALGAGLLATGVGLAVIFTGAQLGLEAEDLPPGVRIREPLSVKLNAAVAVDEAMRWVEHTRSIISPKAPPRAYADALRAAAERHRDQGWLEHPERAHPVPPALEKLETRRDWVRGVGRAEFLRFESEYEPNDPEIHKAFLGVGCNRTAHAALWRHSGEPRPTLLCVHGYAMGRVGFDARVFGVRWLHQELGLDVATVVLPLHGPRSQGRRSGEGFLGRHPLWTNAAVGQTIWELRRLTGWLRSQGAPAVGVYGLSLGGYVTALLASLDNRLACAIPGVPFASWADLVLRGLSEDERLAAAAVGVTRAVLEDAWAPYAPLSHTPRVAPRARLIVAGVADRICPPAQAHALWEHWDRPAIHWFPGSHLMPLDRERTRRRLAAHLQDTLLSAGEEPLPLTRFRAGQGALVGSGPTERGNGAGRG